MSRKRYSRNPLFGTIGLLEGIACFGLLVSVNSLAAGQVQPGESKPAAPPAEASEASSPYVALAVYPPQILLQHAQARLQPIAVATRADGTTCDVTKAVEWSFPDAKVAGYENGAVVPRGDGAALLEARLGKLTAKTDVQVKNAGVQKPVSFRQDVMPVFMRAGCNAGGCHGSSRGKDGFQLSLFGYDPAGDHFRLTRELATRRINRAMPADSLLLKKATGSVPHTGGKRFEKGSDYYRVLHNWIAAGAPSDVDTAAAVSKLTIYPPQAVLSKDDRQSFIAIAEYADGVQRDVTDFAVFKSTDGSIADIDSQGQVAAGSRGEAFVMARFETETVVSPVLVRPTESTYQPREEAPANYIDTTIAAKLAALEIAPSELCGDREFLRRATVDLAGRMPTIEELAAFLADDSSEKRSQAIDRLIDSPEFSDVWTKKFAELLMVRTEVNRVDYKGMYLYFHWIADQVAANRPLNEFVAELLSASGPTFDVPATNFYQIEPLPQKTAENVAQAFLGIRIQCTQCHNHPFDRWTMDDYYSFTAFFARVGRKPAEDYRETIVFDRGGGETNHPVGGRVMAPKFLGGEQPKTGSFDRRKIVAQWVTSDENPYFARSLANRIWAHFFGRGVVEPVDDIRVSNPPSNQALFDSLGAKLVEYDFDLRRLVRDICNSNAYQRSSQTNPSNQHDHSHFAYAAVRRLPAEALLDCVSQVTGAPEKLPGLPLGAHAVEVADGKANHYFLKTFGRAQRDTVCACEVRAEPTLSQALHLLNGQTINGKIAQGKFIEQELEAGKKPVEVVDDIYLRCLARRPTDAEHEKLAKLYGEAEKPVAELRDVFWAVLNSREFLFNH